MEKGKICFRKRWRPLESQSLPQNAAEKRAKRQIFPLEGLETVENPKFALQCAEKGSDEGHWALDPQKLSENHF